MPSGILYSMLADFPFLKSGHTSLPELAAISYKASALVRVSIAVIKHHDQKQLREEKICFS